MGEWVLYIQPNYAHPKPIHLTPLYEFELIKSREFCSVALTEFRANQLLFELSETTRFTTNAPFNEIMHLTQYLSF